MKIGIILTPDERSKAYLQKIISNKINLDEIIFMNDNRKEKNFSNDVIYVSKKYGFDISTPVHETLEKNNLAFKEFDFVNINHNDLIKYIKKTNIDYFIFTGGGILLDEVLNTGKKFIHFHPGIVPFYRGSTCFYYSIINEDKCGVTSYIMNEQIDAGKIIYQRLFEKPDHIFIDDVYDHHIRSETLIDVLKKNMLQTKIFKMQPKDGETYYIIHPVLKHVAILSCITDNKPYKII